MPIYSHCADCRRPLRTVRYANPDAPDAVTHHGHGLCKTCHDHGRRPRAVVPELVRPCECCQRSTRPASRKDLDGLARGTAKHCKACHAHERRGMPCKVGAATPRRESSTTAEDFHFIAETSGGTRAPTRIGWDKRTRKSAAARLRIDVGTLDRALYRDADRRAA